MRTRDLKPGFFRDQGLAELPPITRLLYAGLWCFGDKRGRMPDNPKLIKADIFPYENVPIEKHLRLLAEAGFIERYEADGQRCIWIPKFRKHQHPHPKEPESVLPRSANDTEGATEAPLPVPEKQRPDHLITGDFPSNTLASNALTTKSSIPSSDLAGEQSPALSSLWKTWENRVGFLSPTDFNEFRECATKVPAEWFEAAIDQTLAAKPDYDWPYCKAILNGCIETGRPPSSVNRIKGVTSVSEVLKHKQTAKQRR